MARGPGRPPVWLPVTLAMVAVLWVVAPLPLLFDVTTTVTDFTRRELTPGGVPAPEEWRGSMTAEAAFATALAVGVPLTGLVLALRWRRVVAAGLFTCAVGLGIWAGAAVVAQLA